MNFLSRVFVFFFHERQYRIFFLRYLKIIILIQIILHALLKCIINLFALSYND